MRGLNVNYSAFTQLIDIHPTGQYIEAITTYKEYKYELLYRC